MTLALHRQLRLRAWRGELRRAHDQGCRCALHVVTARGNSARCRLARPRARQRRHDHSMRQPEKDPAGTAVTRAEVHTTQQRCRNFEELLRDKDQFHVRARNSRETDDHQGGGRPAHGIVRQGDRCL